MKSPTPAKGPYYGLVRSRELYGFSEQNSRAYLFNQQFPIDANSGTFIFLTVFSQPARQLAHPLQAVPSIQKILDILGHDLRDIPKLVV